MTITFNAAIEPGCFGPGQVWYYGTDGNEGTNIELLPVVLHEMGHGLGFATLTNGSSGAYASGFPDIFDKFLLDKTSNTHWDTNTAAQRAASAIALDKLVWDGPEAVSYATKFLTVGQPEVKVNSPGGIAASSTPARTPRSARRSPSPASPATWCCSPTTRLRRTTDVKPSPTPLSSLATSR
jgi:hypothetical protein